MLALLSSFVSVLAMAGGSGEREPLAESPVSDADEENQMIPKQTQAPMFRPFPWGKFSVIMALCFFTGCFLVAWTGGHDVGQERSSGKVQNTILSGYHVYQYLAHQCRLHFSFF